MRKPFDGEYDLTQGFGVNPDYYKQYLVKQPDGSVAPMKGHNGLDYGTPSWTPVLAPHKGMVVEATFDPKGYGNYVKIENEQEGSVLAHLDKVSVNVGFQVNEGDLIGTSDNTGYSTGPHLHWGYYPMPRNYKNGYAGFVDQKPILDKLAATTPVTPSVPSGSPPVSGQLHTDEEYRVCMTDREKFWKERDVALTQLKEANKKLEEAKAKLTAFGSLGYNSVDDVIKEKKENESKYLGVQAELTQVLRRSSALAGELQQKDKEDYTAIEAGMAAIKELGALKGDVIAVKKAVGIEGKKASIWDILSKIELFKEKATVAVEKAKEEANVTPDQVKSAVKEAQGAVKNGGWDWVMKLLGFLTVIVLGVLVFYLR